MILEIDMGNSRMKWRLRDHERSHQRGDSGGTDTSDFPAIFKTLRARPNCIWVASVVPALNGALTDWCFGQWGVRPTFAQVKNACEGLSNAYHDVSQMGVDRWLAMVAAYAKCRSACLIVDSGSALTVDLVLPEGQHLGGYIAPGLELMREALFRDTGRVKPSTIGYDGELSPGLSTQHAVNSGLGLMHIALVETALRELLNQSRVPPEVVVTGGFAQAMVLPLQKQLSQRDLLCSVKSLQVQMELVLDGLRWVVDASPDIS